MKNLTNELISIPSMVTLDRSYTLYVQVGHIVHPISYHNLNNVLVHEEKTLTQSTVGEVRFVYKTKFKTYEVIMFDTYVIRNDIAYVGFLNLKES